MQGSFIAGATISPMHPRALLSIGNFFSSAHFFLTVFVVAPYLALFMPASRAGLVVSLGAVVTLILFPLMPRLVSRYGARHLALVLAVLQALVLSLLATSPGIVLAVICIALTSAISPLIAYQLDLLLEHATREENVTGRVRALFLTTGNVALILSPLLIGYVLNGSEAYSRVFLASALSLAPFIVLFLFERLPEVTPPVFSAVGMTCKCIWGDRDLRAAALANAVLQFFYHLAPLYIPLYLHTTLGIPWSDLGWIFAVMLLPFVFIEYPAGWIADRWLGEKELLLAGFVITGLTFAVVGFITASTPLYVIAGILFMTRVGAALVESMVEGHFFKRVSERDANTISIFRMTRPLAALTAPVIASIILFSGGYLVFFMSTGALIVALGIISSIAIHDLH